MTQEEVSALVDKTVKVSEDYYKKTVLPTYARTAKPPVPEYFPGYRFRIDLRERVKPHSELGYRPDALLARLHPHESEAEGNWIRENFKQTTLPVYQDFKTTISRVFHDANWDVDYSPVKENLNGNPAINLQQYLEALPIWGSLEMFWQSVLLDNKLVDANALLVVKPHRVDRVESQEDENVMVVDNSMPFEPVPFIYGCERVVGEDLGNWYMVELPERTVVKYNSTEMRIGRVFEVYDRDTIWRAEQTGSFNANTFIIYPYFQHNWGKVPAWYLGGVSELRDEGGEQRIHQVPRFRYATDLLDLTLLNEQYHNAVLAKCAFPHKIMYGTPCENTWKYGDDDLVCDGGYGHLPTGEQVLCQKCKGTGLRERLSPLGVLLVRPPSSTKENDKGLSGIEPLSFVSPDTEISRFLQEKIDRDEAKARRILHMSDTKTDASNPEKLATDLLMDEKAKMDFLKPEAMQLFYLYENMHQAANWMRYAEKEKQPRITYPIAYDFQTEGDYLQQLSAARAANVPPSVMEQIVRRYVRALYTSDAQQTAFMETLLGADRLLALTMTEIGLLQGRGSVSPWEEVLHVSGASILADIASRVEGFWELDPQERITQLQDAAKVKAQQAASDRASRQALVTQIVAGAQ